MENFRHSPIERSFFVSNYSILEGMFLKILEINLLPIFSINGRENWDYVWPFYVYVRQRIFSK